MDLLRRASTWYSSLPAENEERLREESTLSHEPPAPVPAANAARHLFNPNVHQIRFSSTSSGVPPKSVPDVEHSLPSRNRSESSRRKGLEDAHETLAELDFEETSLPTARWEAATKPPIEIKTSDPLVPLSEQQIPDLPKLSLDITDSNPDIWTYRKYRDSDGKCPPLEICTSLEAAERSLANFVSEPILGFDTEWVPHFIRLPYRSIKHKVSLVQLASPTRITLIHVARFPGSDRASLLPPTLKRILEDSNIAKAGVNIVMDAFQIRAAFGIDVLGQVELSHWYKLVKHLPESPHLVNRVKVNLATQVEDHFQMSLDKGPTRTSNWAAELSMDQAVYAANDAFASVMLFWHMEAMRRKMNPVPPLPGFDEEKKPIRLGSKELEQKAEKGREDDRKKKKRLGSGSDSTNAVEEELEKQEDDAEDEESADEEMAEEADADTTTSSEVSNEAGANVDFGKA